MAGQLAANIGVDHCILAVKWEGPLPSRNAVQKPARNHRYRLLLEICQKHNINALMMGHHLNDQIGKVWFTVGMTR